MIKYVIFFSLLFLGCKTKNYNDTCPEVSDIEFERVRQGFIGANFDPQGELCFEGKKRNLVGLKKACIIELYGAPAEVRGKIYSYYFGDAKNKMVVGKLKIEFSSKDIAKKVWCVLV